MENLEITHQILIICEGTDDKIFINEIFKRSKSLNSKTNDIQIETSDGFDKIGKLLKVIKKLANYSKLEKILIFCDHDVLEKDRFRSVSNSLRKAGIPCATSSGKWSNTGKPQTMVYVFPDNKNPGMLETLCYRSIQNSKLTNCIEEFENCTVKTGLQIKNSEKMRMLTYIAAHTCSISLGVAAQKGIIEISSLVFDDLRKVLGQLFK